MEIRNWYRTMHRIHLDHLELHAKVKQLVEHLEHCCYLNDQTTDVLIDVLIDVATDVLIDVATDVLIDVAIDVK